MKYRYLPVTIMLFAGAVTSIACIVREYDPLNSLKLLLAVLLIFWMIGGVTRILLLRIVGMGEKEENKTAEKDKDDETERADGTPMEQKSNQ